MEDLSDFNNATPTPTPTPSTSPTPTPISLGENHISANTTIEVQDDEEDVVSVEKEGTKKRKAEIWNHYTVKKEDVNLATLVLDPRYKLEYVTWNFKKIYEEPIADVLTKGVRDTMVRLFQWYSSEGYERDVVMKEKESEKVFDDSYDLEFKSLKEEQDVLKNKNELERYFVEMKERSVCDFDVLAWWNVNAPRYQILSQIARDILAVPISSVALESAFSTGGRILDLFRSSLCPKTVEALICGQNWLRSSHPPLDLPQHVEENMEDLETSTLTSMQQSQQ